MAFMKLQDKINALRTKMMKSICAFSLIEMSIVICIMGALMSYAIPSYLNMRTAAKIKQSQNKIESLLTVLAAYAHTHGTLPYASLSTANFGISQPGVLTGIVPYHTLNLQESDAKDGFGKWIIYAVAKTATISNSSHSFCKTLPTKTQGPFLTVKTENGVISEKGRAGEAEYYDYLAVILASGEITAHQADSQSGGQHNPMRAFSETTHKSAKGPHIRWITRNNLMSIYAKTPCIYNIEE